MRDDVQALELLKAYHTEIEQYSSPWKLEPGDLATGRAILSADDQLRIAVICALLCHLPQPGYVFRASRELLRHLCRRSLPYTLDDIHVIVQALRLAKHPYHLPAQALLRALARPLADPAMLAACQSDLEQLREAAHAWYSSADQRKFLKLLDELLGGKPERPVPIHPDSWGIHVLVLLDEMESDLHDNWLALLRHCSAATGSTPGGAWLARMQPLVAALGKETFSRLASALLCALRKGQGTRLDEGNADLLKGLAWCCVDVEDAALASALADAAIEGYRKIPGLGPRSARVAGACVSALKSMPGLHGAAQLERVRLHVKQPTYLKGVEKALDEAAHRAGMSREDLEELTVPTFGLEQGRLRVPIGQAVAELQIEGPNVHIHWYDAAGHPQKAEPAGVKRSYKAERKDLKRLSDDVSRMLAAQRDRVERLPLAERTWSLPAWRERYLEHPLVGGVAKRLIWRFIDGERIVDGIWYDDQVVDAHDQPVELSETATVAAWHPILCNAAEVLAWRTWLERREVTQPFKQVHREVYLLTDAERTTAVYSNRFAAHILRQHQFNALAAASGWRNQLRLMVDDTYPPATLELPHWGLRAEFWIEGAGDDYGSNTNDAGTYLYVSTDQVRFYPIDAAANRAQAGSGAYSPAYDWQRQGQGENEPLPLERIPALVFSEVMRDVDLFIGVASVGNDPTWQDGGPQGHYRTYWHAYSFGELSATAETRKQLLSRLIPRLTIASRCAIEGRFLKVRGDRRTYKIHLGSGNILMEPNDQYLCIVPGRRSAASTPGIPGNLFLPFEGDAVLSIILSKVFLLAEDTKITDQTITRQIGLVEMGHPR
jgi:hypothetical protein